MKRATKVEMACLYFEEAQELEHAERGKHWRWKDDDMTNFREGIEKATEAHVQRLFDHWKVRANKTTRRALNKALDAELKRFQDATSPYWGDIGPNGALM